MLDDGAQEALAVLGGDVTAIDAAPNNINVATDHARSMGLIGLLHLCCHLVQHTHALHCTDLDTLGARPWVRLPNDCAALCDHSVHATVSVHCALLCALPFMHAQRPVALQKTCSSS